MNKPVWTLCALTLILGAVLPACRKKEPAMAASAMPGKTLYHCAMHPQIVSDKPGECPICHMKLTRFEVGTPGEPMDDTMTPGQATVRLSPGVEQRIGVQTVEAQVMELFQSVRAAARVAYDPQLYSAALEHREARKFLAQAGDPDSREQAETTVRASELRLRQMGLSDAQIDEISKPDYDLSSLLVGSRSGRMWVYADVFDNQAASVHAGQSVDHT